MTFKLVETGSWQEERIANFSDLGIGLGNEISKDVFLKQVGSIFLNLQSWDY